MNRQLCLIRKASYFIKYSATGIDSISNHEEIFEINSNNFEKYKDSTLQNSNYMTC